MTHIVKHHPPSGSPCGDADVCGLDCLERPNFRPGQVLKAADLDALVGWTAQRFALIRHRQGWGVACGLDVVVDPRNPKGIIVEPGYAIDCCGNDLVLCKPYCLDLACFCTPEPDPCLCPKPIDAPAEKSCWIGGCEFPKSELVAVDIVLEGMPRPHSGSACACGRGGGCGCGCASPSGGNRITDTAVARARPAQKPDEPWVDFKRAWEHVRAEAGEPTKWQPRHFPWLAHAKEEMRRWRRIDGWLSLLAAPCRACGPDDLVRLARVWLHRSKKDERGRACCVVIHIAVYSPWRRPLHLDWPPAPPGSINLPALLLWRTVPEAELALRQHGLKPGKADDGTSPPFIAPHGQTVELVTYKNPDNHTCFAIDERVLDWRIASTEKAVAENPAPALAVAPAGKPAAASKAKAP